MIRGPFNSRLFLLLALLPLVGAHAQAAPAPDSADVPARAARPLVFEPNAGQAPADVRFLSHATAGTFFFMPASVLLAPGPPNAPGSASPAPPLVSLQWQGAQAATVHPGPALPGRVSYYRGADSAQWQTDLPTYAGLTYQGLYPGVDVAWGGTEGRLKATYLVAAGADPRQIRWHYQANGARVQTGIDGQGNLQIRIGDPQTPETAREMTEAAPIAWQESAGTRVPVSVRYTLGGDGSAGFALGTYDPSLPLTIDPTLVYGTYLGGAGSEAAYSVAVDSAHNIYLAGYTTSSFTFPPQNSQLKQGRGYWDAFVTKLAPDGQTLLFSTYLSGTDWDAAHGLAVDAAGNIYVTGETASHDFPVRGGVQTQYGGGAYDAFVTKFSPAGALLASTYVGASGADRGRGLALAGAGHLVLAGYTDSHDFPAQQAAQSKYGGGFFDGFATMLNTDLASQVYSTYLGGGDQEFALGVAADAVGNAYVTGRTQSGDFPIKNAYQGQRGGGFDAFVTRLDPSGALGYSTYLGGSGTDEGQGIAVDDTGSVYITGDTGSPNFPIANAYQAAYKGAISTAFVTRLRPDGGGLVYSTYLGGSGGSEGSAGLSVAVDATGAAYVTGRTDATDFPLQTPLQSSYGGGASEAFVAKLDPAGAALRYATYLGGQGSDTGYSLAVDDAGNAYVSGETTSLDLPLAQPFQADRQGAGDIFVVKIADAPDASLTPRPIHSPGPVPTYMLAEGDEDTSDETATTDGSPDAGQTATATEDFATPIAPAAPPVASAPSAVPPTAATLPPAPTIAARPSPTATPPASAGGPGLLLWAMLGLIGAGVLFFLLRFRRPPA